jgi:NAD+ diphosphatase
MEFIPRFEPDNKIKGQRLLLFASNEQYMAVDSTGNPFLEDIPADGNALEVYLGSLDGFNLSSLSFDNQIPLPDHCVWISFKDGYRSLEPLVQYPVSRGKLLQEWRRTHRFCGSCGSKTVLSEKEHVQKCPSCGDSWYPRTAPAIIVRITSGKKVLLAHNAHFPEGLFSNIAGFVDPGETLEQAIDREVFEEVGLKVQNIRYFGSQSWPMPHSLMLGFTAETLNEDTPIPDGEEITEARWFTPETLPDIPGPGSIAGRMLLDYLSEAKSSSDRG